MFHTLKITKSTDTPCTFDTTSTPVSKKRDGNLARVACTNCRLSKLKCSGDADGCKRCLAKKMDCHYPTRVRSNSENKIATPAPTPRATTPWETTQRTRQFSIATGDSNPENDFWIESNQASTLRSTHDSASSDMSPHFDVTDFTTAAEDMTTLLADKNCSDSQELGFPSFPDINSTTSWSGTCEPEIADFCFDTESWPTVPSNSTGASACHCITQAVVTYEAIEVAAWGRKKLLNDLDMLQSQKMALTECEKLVECPNCNVQPAYMMLLLSMLRKLIATLDDICSREGTGASQAATKKDRETQNGKRLRLSDECQDEAGPSRKAYDDNADNLNLDDEDKLLVLQSLVSARVVKLNHLLSLVDKAVSRHTWPVHGDLVKELRHRLTGRAFVMDRRRFASSN